MATDKLTEYRRQAEAHLQRMDSLAADLFTLVRGCADLTIDQTARIVKALLVAGYRRQDGP